ncbi:hypothetical protein [Sphingomonas panacisoli]|uniref:hypothetical protein n=1 Tax=Sphingomonas panacisoli TaxID=1813879 RepID=UPI001646812D|nr:hypothetical protein [Sphingomonas panacisoli]
MDLNYLFHRHQVSIMRAEAATCASSRSSHNSLARAYAQRIRVMQDNLEVAEPFGVHVK